MCFYPFLLLFISGKLPRWVYIYLYLICICSWWLARLNFSLREIPIIFVHRRPVLHRFFFLVSSRPLEESCSKALLACEEV